MTECEDDVYEPVNSEERDSPLELNITDGKFGLISHVHCGKDEDWFIIDPNQVATEELTSSIEDWQLELSLTTAAPVINSLTLITPEERLY